MWRCSATRSLTALQQQGKQQDQQQGKQRMQQSRQCCAS